jgi:energy-coupling factor transporter ATP-binding protein EcfA2
LRAVGLDVPMVTRLGQNMKAHGWVRLPEVILTTEQLKQAIRPLDDRLTGDKATTSRMTYDRVISSRTTDNRTTSNVECGFIQHVVDPTIADDSGSGKEDHKVQNDSKDIENVQARPLIELRDVHYTRLHNTPFAVEALRGVSLSVFEGQVMALVGPTKAGKSTVVDLLAGLIKPAAGTLLFQDTEVNTPAMIERLRSHVGVVFQSPESQIFEDTVGKDVSFGPRRKKVSLAESRQRVLESLEAVGLSYEDFRTRYTYALSGGEKRRVAIAGVLALQPGVIVFDEPTAGLDPRGRREFLELLRKLKQERNLTIVYTSSSLEDVIGLADTFYILDQGRTVRSGTAREILAQSSELAALDIALPEPASIALSLQEVLPTLRTDVLRLAELEEEIGYP